MKMTLLPHAGESDLGLAAVTSAVWGRRVGLRHEGVDLARLAHVAAHRASTPHLRVRLALSLTIVATRSSPFSPAPARPNGTDSPAPTSSEDHADGVELAMTFLLASMTTQSPGRG